MNSGERKICSDWVVGVSLEDKDESTEAAGLGGGVRTGKFVCGETARGATALQYP